MRHPPLKPRGKKRTKSWTVWKTIVKYKTSSLPRDHSEQNSHVQRTV
jgi:hypothetical protein